jgi:hypothetical protein
LFFNFSTISSSIPSSISFASFSNLWGGCVVLCCLFVSFFCFWKGVVLFISVWCGEGTVVRGCFWEGFVFFKANERENLGWVGKEYIWVNWYFFFFIL